MACRNFARFRFACAVVCAALATAGVPAGATALSWPGGLQVTSAIPLQTGGVDPTLNSTACWSSNLCVSVGEDDQSGGEHPIVVVDTYGVASAAAVVTVPPGALTGNSATASLNSVSCSSAGACVAVGEYQDLSGIVHGLVVSIRNGKIGAAVAASAPGASGQTYLRSVSCPLVGVCEAVGTYGVNGNANQDGVLVTITNGTPGLVSTITMPTNANAAAPLVSVNSVSCWASGDCVAAGQYLASSGSEIYPVVIPISNGVPAAGIEVTLPSNAYTGTGGQQSVLGSVSCQETGACVAAGDYVDSSGGSLPLVVPITTADQPAVVDAVSLPANAGVPTSDDGLNAVSCGPTGACEAVGYYVDSFGSGEPLSISVSGTTVSAGTELKLPSSALSLSGGIQAASLSAVACPQSNSCLAVGEYDDSSANQQALVEPVSATSTGDGVTLPGGFVANPDAALGAVACTTSASCLAVGGEHDATAQPQAFQDSLPAGLTIATPRLPKAYVGTAYASTLTASGAWNSYTWARVSGRMPAGLSLNAKTGKISGRPRTVVSYKPTFRATAITGTPAQSVTKKLTIVVTATPVFSSTIPRGGFKLSGQTVSLRARCAKGVACRGTLTLVYAHVVTLKQNQRQSESTVIGRLNYSLKADKSRTVKIKLTTAGLRFVKDAKGRKLTIALGTTLKGGKSSSRPTTVRGPAPPAPKKKAPKKKKKK